MKRYIFYGYYHHNESLISSYGSPDTEIIGIPLLGENQEFLYGIQNTFKSLLRLSITPSKLGFGIMALATMVYLADTRVSRDVDSQDSWSREFTLLVPVSNLELWSQTKDLFEKMLLFLTGDIWKIDFIHDDFDLDEIKPRVRIVSNYEYDIVSLFSGGMDSLIFAIDCLQAGKKPLFVSHADNGFTKNYQQKLIKALRHEYNGIDFSQVNLWMSFSHSLVNTSSSENTTRGRSFLFISFALFTLSGLPQINMLNVPENGLIALNVPLDELRVGSHSTRTTHPYYFKLWNEILDMLGVNKHIVNQYWNETKGEMASNCTNKELLIRILPVSVSCSSPTKYKWRKIPPQHCGHCVPCIIRRAAINYAFGLDKDETVYTFEDLKQLENMHASETGAQLRSFNLAISRLLSKPLHAEYHIHKSGPLNDNPEYLTELSEVYKRGIYEVHSLINYATKE